MEGENRMLARWEAFEKAFKRSKSVFRPDKYASEGTSSNDDIVCDPDSLEFVCAGC